MRSLEPLGKYSREINEASGTKVRAGCGGLRGKRSPEISNYVFFIYIISIEYI